MAKKTTTKTTATPRAYTKRKTVKKVSRLSSGSDGEETVTIQVPKQMAFGIGFLIGQAQARQ
jgi:hypothetical protein